MAKFESIENIRVSNESSGLIKIDLDLFDATTNNDIYHKVLLNDFFCLKLLILNKILIWQTLTIGFLSEDYLQFLYLLQGYLKIDVFPIKNRLCPIQEIKTVNTRTLDGNYIVNLYE